MKNIFNSQLYKGFMFIAMITVSLLILFSFTDLTKELRKKTISGYFTSELDSTNKNYSNIDTNQDEEEPQYFEYQHDDSESEDYEFENIGYYEYSDFKKSDLYQAKSSMIFYLIVIALVAVIIIVAILLRSAMIHNIYHEHEENSI